MNRCACGGVVRFIKSFEEGKVSKDITSHTCACGCTVFIINGTPWFGGWPITTKKL